MIKRTRSALLALALVFGLLTGTAGCSTPAETKASKPAADTPVADTNREALFISVADLAADTTQFTILDSRDPKAYEAGHIEGAISVPWQSFASVAKGEPGDEDWGTLLPAAEIASAAGRLGIDVSKTVVVYSDPTGWGEDGRVAWTLQSIGIENVKMLDGGFPAWTAGGNAASKDVPEPAPTTVTVARDGLADFNVTTDEVKTAIESSSAIILDVRSSKEYDGATDFGEARGGHLPGAVNVPFPDNFNEDGTLKSNEELIALYADAGISKDTTVYAYCTKGIRSAFVYEVLKMLGFKAPRNYDASFYSWAGDSTLPIDK